MRWPLYVVLIVLAASTLSQGYAAPTPSLAAGVPPAGATSVPLETVQARKAAVEAQLKTLADSNLPKETLEARRHKLDQLLNVLTALEGAIRRRESYAAQLEALPQRLRQLAAEKKALESQPPPHPSEIDEARRDDYEARLQAVQNEISELNKQTAAGEVRLAAIPHELEQRAQERMKLERDLLAARARADRAADDLNTLDLEILTWQLHRLRADTEALEAERAWLSRRGPLQDALLAVAQLRLKRLQQALEMIQQALGSAIEREQTALARAAAELEQKRQQSTDPVDMLRLTLELEAVEIRRATAAYREQLNQVGEALLRQEKRHTDLKRDVDRLTSLVEKYTSGEGIVQRMLVAFERLKRERLRFNDKPMKALEARLQRLTDEMFALDDRLYDFTRQGEARLATVQSVLQALPARQRDAALAPLRQALEAQRSALRDQQQVLVALVQDHTRLLGLHRTHKRLLDDSYLFVLTKMFWLRDAKTLNGDVLRDMADGAITTLKRLHLFGTQTRAALVHKLRGAFHLWAPTLVVLLGLPWMVGKLRRALRLPIAEALRRAAERQQAPGLGTALFIILRAVLWPAYVMFLAWFLGTLLPALPEEGELAFALVQGLQLAALSIGVCLAGRALLKPQGWGACFWGIDDDLCQFLRRMLVLGCLGAVLFLVPRQVLLSAPGDGDAAVGSLALARAFFLGFQTVMLLLVGILGRRHGPLMSGILNRSREQDGLLWRLWPVLYLLSLGGIIALMVLDVLGYRYAAQFIWLRALGSLSVVLTLRLLLIVLALRLLHTAVGYVFSIGGRLRQRYPDVEAAADRYFQLAYTCSNALLTLLGIAVILELWGISVTWFVTSPVGLQILSRTLVIAFTVGIAVGVTQISNAFTDYLVQPKTTPQGVVRQPSRKLKTLAPLIQTLIRVGAVFVAVLVILEQLNVATAPILTGVGIFGLAVGFASQSLIKDVINGLFILFEDSLSVGDVVTLRNMTGVVEKVTLRAVTMRDLAGNVHLIPNSTIDMITNLTKEYSRYVLEVRVALRENVDRVIDLLRQVDAELRADPLLGPHILEPLEVQGLDRFEESGMIIRARIKTRPQQQWRVGREFNRRMKKAFDDHGIEIPLPQRVLHWRTPSEAPSLREADEHLSHLDD